MKRIFITGATGNVGIEVIRYLLQSQSKDLVIAGVRDPDKARRIFGDNRRLILRYFDFEEQSCYEEAFRDVSVTFLLRPPHISDVGKYFAPLISAIARNTAGRIVFLSVQGAEKSSIIPHNRIEHLIRVSGMDYIFLRPSYFMQNLTTTLIGDIRKKRKIILPAGRAKFNWIDIRNIGEATAVLLQNFGLHKNMAYDLTGTENLDFYAVAEMIRSITGERIEYKSLDPFSFYLEKRNDGTDKSMTLVMTMLHFLPRLSKEPAVSDSFRLITGKSPGTLGNFLEANREAFRAS